jgi:hypothetical protein
MWLAEELGYHETCPTESSDKPRQGEIVEFYVKKNNTKSLY